MNEKEFEAFIVKSNYIKPKTGNVLISAPLITDIYFKNTILFLTEHNYQGSFGLVLNRPHRKKLHEVYSGIKQKNISLWYGGPVANDTIFYIHSKGKSVPHSEYIGKGLYWGGDFSIVRELLENGEISTDEIRFFLGYSGWSASQLEDEINKDSWIVADLTTKSIMNKNHTDLWRESLKSLGGKYSLWAEFPDDPLLN